MGFRYGCFLSYRHGDEQMVTLVENIRDALVNELNLYLDIKEVFQDKKDIGPGNWVRETISLGICQSVVMILVYTPKYFSTARLFCSSELEGMLRLEERRAKKAGLPKQSIVIPIMLRGEVADLPHDLKNRNPVDLTGLSMATPEVLRNIENMQKIRDIAKRVHGLLTSMEKTGKTFCDDCSSFFIFDENDPAEKQKLQDFVSKYKTTAWQPEFVIS